MFCSNCGKEIPDGAKFCNHCGAPLPEPAPRHARPEPETEEVYSYSDKNLHDTLDLTAPEEPTRVFDPIRDAADQTRVYGFERFEDDRPQQEQPIIPNNDIDDSYDNYYDGEDDETFMDRMDNRFRRDDDDRPQKSSKTWLWITLAVLAAVLIIVFAILAFSGSIFKGNNKPTVMPTAVATVKPTEKPTEKTTEKPTEPAPTKAPETKAPETQAPETEAPPITEAPKPTDPPTEPPTEVPTELPTEISE